MNTAHTPGPWNWDGNVCDYDATQEAPWLVHADNYPPILGGQIKCVNEADARLIAAAPDLLAACQSVIASFEAFTTINSINEEDASVTACRAAIAKAVQS